MQKWRKYEVKDVSSVEDFLNKYTKHDRHAGWGPEYVAMRIKTHKQDLLKYGYCFMSRHESVTGQPVAYFGKP